MRRCINSCWIVLAGCALILVSGCLSPRLGNEDSARLRQSQLKGTFGTYAGEPRLPSGRVDVERLVNELTSIHARTYNWLIWHAATDWDDLHQFLPLAAERGISVWVSLVPPSESPPRTKSFSEPFRLDYERWAIEIAQLSKHYPNLVAWSLDDFSHNTKDFTPKRLERILSGARQINPRLAFVPCVYFGHVTPAFADAYSPLLDGILFPFRNESAKPNLTDFTAVETEVQRLRELFGGGIPIFLDVYATGHSRLGDSAPEYVRQVMLRGRTAADGVLIYCHQSKDRSPSKYGVIQDLFTNWAGK